MKARSCLIRYSKEFWFAFKVFRRNGTSYEEVGKRDKGDRNSRMKGSIVSTISFFIWYSIRELSAQSKADIATGSVRVNRIPIKAPGLAKESLKFEFRRSPGLGSIDSASSCWLKVFRTSYDALYVYLKNKNSGVQ